jgi:hypothetical protein
MSGRNLIGRQRRKAKLTREQFRLLPSSGMIEFWKQRREAWQQERTPLEKEERENLTGKGDRNE